MHATEAAEYVRHAFASECWSVELDQLKTNQFQVIMPENVRGLTEGLMEIYNETGYLADLRTYDGSCTLCFWQDPEWDLPDVSRKGAWWTLFTWLIISILVALVSVLVLFPPAAQNITTH